MFYYLEIDDSSMEDAVTYIFQSPSRLRRRETRVGVSAVQYEAV